jgi:hypothetical protein
MSLHEKSGFNKLLSYYNENRDKHWYEWLSVKTIFPKHGKQGIVGIMSAKHQEDIFYVFKISQYINHLVQHEYTVMSGLNELSDFCPHYCRVVGMILCDVDPSKKENPFEKTSNNMVEKEVLLMEYIDQSYKFTNYIISRKIQEHIIYSIIKQTLLGISISQNKKKFTHYDLHSNNIMIKRCSRDLVILYILDNQTQFCIPTYGYYPVIIDFGFSYIKDLEGQSFWSNLNHTDIGMMTDRFDNYADPKLFLVTTSKQLKKYKYSKNTKKLLNIVKNNYKFMNIDWNSGWDNYTEKCATDYVIDILSDYSFISTLFSKEDYYCINLLQTLIILPLEPQSYTNIDIVYTTFLKEFVKIENEISSPFYCLYILKAIVDSARIVRFEYCKKETRNQAVSYFRYSILEVIDSLVKYCRPKNIHFEKMLCSLLSLSKCIEGILYEAMINETNDSEKIIPLKSPEEIYKAIDINIPDNYEFNYNTTILAIDCVKNSCYTVNLEHHEYDKINLYDSINRGKEIYKLFSPDK